MTEAYIITKTEYKSLHVWKETESDARRLCYASISFALGLIVQAATSLGTLTSIGVSTLVVGIIAAAAIAFFCHRTAERLGKAGTSVGEIVENETVHDSTQQS